MYSVKKNIIACIKLAGGQLACSIFCFIFAMLFGRIVTSKIGGAIYTIVAILISFEVFYSRSWELGNKDRRDIKIYNNHIEDGKEPICANKLHGLYLGCMYLIINAIFYAFFVFSPSISKNMGAIGTAVYRFWQCPYLFILSRNDQKNYILSAVVCVFPIIFTTLGYITGLKGKNYIDEFMYKLVYKKKVEKNDKD